MTMTVRAAFFDLYETLITEFADGRRISRRRYDYPGLLGLSEDDFKQEWKARQEGRMRGIFPNYRTVIRDILEQRNLPYREEQVEFLYQSRLKEKQLPFEAVRPDVIEMLDRLKKRGLKLGLISNCTAEEVLGFESSPLASRFDAVIFSYEAGLSKPQQEIYRLACERLSVAPEESIFIGDGGSDELNGAQIAGLRPYHAVWFNTYIDSGWDKLHAPLDLLDRLSSRAGSEIIP